MLSEEIADRIQDESAVRKVTSHCVRSCQTDSVPEGRLHSSRQCVNPHDARHSEERSLQRPVQPKERNIVHIEPPTISCFPPPLSRNTYTSFLLHPTPSDYPFPRSSHQ